MSRKDRFKKQRKKELEERGGVAVKRPSKPPSRTAREFDGVLVFRSVADAKAAVANARGEDRGIVRTFERYDVTIKPLSHPRLQGLTLSQRERLDHVTKAVRGDFPETDHMALLREILALIDEMPEVPQLYAHLHSMLKGFDRDVEAFAVGKFASERFPDYLFGQLLYANDCLQAGKPDEAPESFRRADDVAALDPSRRTFHLMEVATFEFAKGVHARLKGDLAEARRRLALIESLHPGFGPLRVLREMIEAVPTN